MENPVTVATGQAPSSTRTGWPATPGRRALTTATATRNGKTPARLPDPDEHVDRRRPHVGPNSAAGRQSHRPRRPARRPAERDVIVLLQSAPSASFRSTDGGATWSAATFVASANFHRPAGDLRIHQLPSAEVDGDGRVYVVWHDCRFRPGCSANDIVMTTTLDGITWTPVTRIPIDPTTSGVDHFIPGIAVDRATSGSSAHSRSRTTTTRSATALRDMPAHRRLRLSLDGGATWTPPTRIAGPMSLSWIADTNQGRMVGDYMSTSFTATARRSLSSRSPSRRRAACSRSAPRRPPSTSPPRR